MSRGCQIWPVPPGGAAYNESGERVGMGPPGNTDAGATCSRKDGTHE